jgi:hypothetical protein
MRIAAGVLIIISAVIELIAGLGLTAFGGLTAGGSKLVEQAAQDVAAKSKDPKAMEAAAKIGDVGTALGGGILIYGLFLLLVCGLDIAAAVVLFREKAPMFALGAGILQLVACTISLVLTGGATIFLNIVGIIAGVFVVIAALGYRSKTPAPVAM